MYKIKIFSIIKQNFYKIELIFLIVFSALILMVKLYLTKIVCRVIKQNFLPNVIHTSYIKYMNTINSD